MHRILLLPVLVATLLLLIAAARPGSPADSDAAQNPIAFYEFYSPF
jgi:hypothetical protein